LAAWDTNGKDAVVLQIYTFESPAPQPIEVLGEAELQLPQGAIIREVSIGVLDNSGRQDLQVTFQSYYGNGQSSINVEMDSSCLQTGTAYSRLTAGSLAVPFNGRVGNFVQFALIPAKTPTNSTPGTAAIIGIDLVTIGYTLQ
jgi:hypothetical protein